MQFHVKHLLTKHRKQILSHIMLTDPHAELVAKTLDGLSDDQRVVDVTVSFNGVKVDAQVLEDWLQYQYKHLKDSFEAKYADQEAEIQRRVAALYEADKENVLTDFRNRFSVVSDKVRQLELVLDIASPNDTEEYKPFL